MNPVWLFPGQGSQYVGMGLDLMEKHPLARELFATADRVLGFPLSRVCFQGPKEDLKRTAVTQPALLTCSVAAARILAEFHPAPPAVAGHSLGEYSALVAAGSLTFEEAVHLVHMRGRFMQEAVPEGEGTMTAVLGLDAAEVSRVCREVAGEKVVQAANLNAPGQVVISGHTDAVRSAVVALKKAGARGAVALDVSVPFHCALMEPAARRLEEALEKVHIRDARMPVWNNVDARPVTSAGDIRAALVRQVASPVRWEESLRGMHETGHGVFLEVGPGKVLAGLARRTLKGTRTLEAGTAAALADLKTSTP
ncbi:MAG: ACP S-malonyltransferase [Acidobacteria bacterium]|nr:MAG: ACP S-malonyltransferase [Acidobacteriota bacterium]